MLIEKNSPQTTFQLYPNFVSILSWVEATVDNHSNQHWLTHLDLLGYAGVIKFVGRIGGVDLQEF